jgi:hypothetical protein
MMTTIVGIVSGVILFLLGLLKYTTKQRDTARKERDQAERNHAIVKNRSEKEDTLGKKQQQVQKESAAHEQTIEEYSGDAPPDDEFFGDSRLRRGDDSK